MDLEEIARELYALPPSEFTAARNARAGEVRAQGDRGLAEQVRRLRRPSAGAWVLDLLAREHPQEVAPVVELGGRLREAMGVLGADDLRALDRQRRELTRAVATRATALAAEAGQPVNAQVTAAVEESLRAAMVDEAAGRALLTGLLTDTFTTTGLDPVDLDRVLALPSLVPARMAVVTAPADGGSERAHPGDDTTAHRAALVAGRAAVREAEDVQSAAQDACVAAARQVTRARTARLELEARRDELARALGAAQSALATAVTQESEADRALEQASAAQARTRAAAQEARSALDAVVRGGASLP